MCRDFKVTNGLAPFSTKLKGFDIEVCLHAKILHIEKYPSGIIKGYKVLVIYEVEKYLLGYNPSSSEEKFFEGDKGHNYFEVAAKALGLIEF